MIGPDLATSVTVYLLVFRISVVLETSQAIVETKFKCPLCHSKFKWKQYLSFPMSIDVLLPLKFAMTEWALLNLSQQQLGLFQVPQTS